MIILPDFNKPYIIDGYTSPILPKYFWTFHAGLFDFTLTPLTFIEENVSAVLKVLINGLELLIPYNWFILICDPETNQLDWVQLNECSVVECFCFLMASSDAEVRTSPIRVLDVIEEQVSYYPILQKQSALCHPVSREKTKFGVETPLSVIISPNDLSKHVIGKYVGDLM
jgi:hypothetical protein